MVVMQLHTYLPNRTDHTATKSNFIHPIDDFTYDMYILAYQEYLKAHCKEEHYTFQVRKCSDPECCPPCVSGNAFPWLPDPVPRQNDKAHYKCFQDVVNTETTGGHRPSSQMDSTKTVAEKLQVC